MTLPSPGVLWAGVTPKYSFFWLLPLPAAGAVLGTKLRVCDPEQSSKSPDSVGCHCWGGSGYTKGRWWKVLVVVRKELSVFTAEIWIPLLLIVK